MPSRISTRMKRVSNPSVVKRLASIGGNAALDYIKETMPITSSTVTDAKSTLSSFKSTYSQGQVTEKVRDLKAQISFKKIGNWFMEEEDSFNNLDSEFGLDFDGLDLPDEDGKSSLSAAQIGAVSERQSKEISKTIVQTSHRLAEAQISSTANLLASVDRLGATVASGFDKVNETLNKLLEVTVKNSSSLIELSAAGLSGDGEKNDTEKMGQGKFDFKEYQNMVKKNLGNSQLGVALPVIQMLMSDPKSFSPKELVSMVFSGAVGKFAPNVEKNLNAIDNAVNDVLMSSLIRLGERGKKDDFVGKIAKAFGFDSSRKETSTERSTIGLKQVPFNTDAHSALTDAIPGYLRKILVQLGGDDVAYDYRSRQFRKSSAIKREFHQAMANIGSFTGKGASATAFAGSYDSTEMFNMLHDLLITAYSTHGADSIAKAINSFATGKGDPIKFTEGLLKQAGIGSREFLDKHKSDIRKFASGLVAQGKEGIEDMKRTVAFGNVRGNKDRQAKANEMNDRITGGISHLTDNKNDNMKAVVDVYSKAFASELAKINNTKSNVRAGELTGVEYTNAALYMIYRRLNTGINTYVTGTETKQPTTQRYGDKKMLAEPKGFRAPMANEPKSSSSTAGKIEAVAENKLHEMLKDAGGKLQDFLFGKDGEKGVLGRVNDSFGDVPGYIKHTFMGGEWKDPATGKVMTRPGIVNTVGDKITELFKGKGGKNDKNLLQLFQGESSGDPADDQKRKKIFGAVAGGLGLGILGGPVGMIVGGLAGAGLSTSRIGEKISGMLFGKADKEGNKQGGLFNKIGGFFKKLLGYTDDMDEDVKVARKRKQVIGGVAGILGGSALGLIGGPVGLLVAGIGGAAMSTSNIGDKIQDMIFGKRGQDGKRDGGLLHPFRQIEKTFKDLSKFVTRKILDPIGDMMYVAKEKAKAGISDFLFGKDTGEVDEDGNPIKSGGLLSPITHGLKKAKNFVADKAKAFFGKFFSVLNDGLKGLIAAPFAAVRMMIGLTTKEGRENIKDTWNQSGKFSEFLSKVGGINYKSNKLGGAAERMAGMKKNEETGEWEVDKNASKRNKKIQAGLAERQKARDKRREAADELAEQTSWLEKIFNVLAHPGKALNSLAGESKVAMYKDKKDAEHELFMNDKGEKVYRSGNMWRLADGSGKIASAPSQQKKKKSSSSKAEPEELATMSGETSEDSSAPAGGMVFGGAKKAVGAVGGLLGGLFGKSKARKRGDANSKRDTDGKFEETAITAVGAQDIETPKERSGILGLLGSFRKKSGGDSQSFQKVKDIVDENYKANQGPDEKQESLISKIFGKVGGLITGIFSGGWKSAFVKGLAVLLGIKEGGSLIKAITGREEGTSVVEAMSTWWNEDSMIGSSIRSLMEVYKSIAMIGAPVVDTMTSGVNFVLRGLKGLPIVGKYIPDVEIPKIGAGDKPFDGLKVAALGGLYFKGASAIGSIASAIASALNAGSSLLGGLGGKAATAGKFTGAQVLGGAALAIGVPMVIGNAMYDGGMEKHYGAETNYNEVTGEKEYIIGADAHASGSLSQGINAHDLGQAALRGYEVQAIGTAGKALGRGTAAGLNAVTEGGFSRAADYLGKEIGESAVGRAGKNVMSTISNSGNKLISGAGEKLSNTAFGRGANAVNNVLSKGAGKLSQGAGVVNNLGSSAMNKLTNLTDAGKGLVNKGTQRLANSAVGRAGTTLRNAGSMLTSKASNKIANTAVAQAGKKASARIANTAAAKGMQKFGQGFVTAAGQEMGMKAGEGALKSAGRFATQSAGKTLGVGGAKAATMGAKFAKAANVVGIAADLVAGKAWDKSEEKAHQRMSGDYGLGEAGGFKLTGQGFFGAKNLTTTAIGIGAAIAFKAAASAAFAALGATGVGLLIVAIIAVAALLGKLFSALARAISDRSDMNSSVRTNSTKVRGVLEGEVDYAKQSDDPPIYVYNPRDIDRTVGLNKGSFVCNPEVLLGGFLHKIASGDGSTPGSEVLLYPVIGNMAYQGVPAAVYVAGDSDAVPVSGKNFNEGTLGKPPRNAGMKTKVYKKTIEEYKTEIFGDIYTNINRLAPEQIFDIDQDLVECYNIGKNVHDTLVSAGIMSKKGEVKTDQFKKSINSKLNSKGWHTLEKLTRENDMYFLTQCLVYINSKIDTDKKNRQWMEVNGPKDDGGTGYLCDLYEKLQDVSDAEKQKQIDEMKAAGMSDEEIDEAFKEQASKAAEQQENLTKAAELIKEVAGDLDSADQDKMREIIRYIDAAYIYSHPTRLEEFIKNHPTLSRRDYGSEISNWKNAFKKEAPKKEALRQLMVDGALTFADENPDVYGLLNHFDWPRIVSEGPDSKDIDKDPIRAVLSGQNKKESKSSQIEKIWQELQEEATSKTPEDMHERMYGRKKHDKNWEDESGPKGPDKGTMGWVAQKLAKWKKPDVGLGEDWQSVGLALRDPEGLGIGNLGDYRIGDTDDERESRSIFSFLSPIKPKSKDDDERESRSIFSFLSPIKPKSKDDDESTISDDALEDAVDEADLEDEDSGGSSGPSSIYNSSSTVNTVINEAKTGIASKLKSVMGLSFDSRLNSKLESAIESGDVTKTHDRLTHFYLKDIRQLMIMNAQDTRIFDTIGQATWAILKGLGAVNTAENAKIKGVGKKRTGLLSPMPGGVAVTSGFSPARSFDGEVSPHKGVDLIPASGSTSSPILADGDGVVERVVDTGRGRLGGGRGRANEIAIRHRNGLISRFGHLKSGINLRPGQRVRAGQVIGQMGNTGKSTGEHLHYEVLAGGGRAAINPLKINRGLGALGRRLFGRRGDITPDPPTQSLGSVTQGTVVTLEDGSMWKKVRVSGHRQTPRWDWEFQGYTPSVRNRDSEDLTSHWEQFDVRENYRRYKPAITSLVADYNMGGSAQERAIAQAILLTRLNERDAIAVLEYASNNGSTAQIAANARAANEAHINYMQSGDTPEEREANYNGNESGNNVAVANSTIPLASFTGESNAKSAWDVLAAAGNKIKAMFEKLFGISSDEGEEGGEGNTLSEHSGANAPPLGQAMIDAFNQAKGTIDGPVHLLTNAEVRQLAAGTDGKSVEVFDLNTGTKFLVNHGGGPADNKHTDWTPTSATSTTIIKGILTDSQHGGNEPDWNETRAWSWKARPAVILINDTLVACGIHLFPHACIINGGDPGPPLVSRSNTRPEGGWEIGGHMCMYFGTSNGGTPGMNEAALLAYQMGNSQQGLLVDNDMLDAETSDPQSEITVSEDHLTGGYDGGDVDSSETDGGISAERLAEIRSLYDYDDSLSGHNNMGYYHELKGYGYQDDDIRDMLGIGNLGDYYSPGSYTPLSSGIASVRRIGDINDGGNFIGSSASAKLDASWASRIKSGAFEFLSEKASALSDKFLSAFGMSSGSDGSGGSSSFFGAGAAAMPWNGAINPQIPESDNEEFIWFWLTGQGLSKELTAGIMGNMWHESRFKLFAHNTNGENSRGLCQWNASRGRAMEEYCAQNGGDWRGNISGQLGYLMVELQAPGSWMISSKGSWLNGRYGWPGNPSGTVIRDTFFSKDDVWDATAIFMICFERPRDQGESNVNNRATSSQTFYERWKDKSPSASVQAALNGNTGSLDPYDIIPVSSPMMGYLPEYRMGEPTSSERAIVNRTKWNRTLNDDTGSAISSILGKYTSEISDVYTSGLGLGSSGSGGNSGFSPISGFNSAGSNGGLVFGGSFLATGVASTLGEKIADTAMELATENGRKVTDDSTGMTTAYQEACRQVGNGYPLSCASGVAVTIVMAGIDFDGKCQTCSSNPQNSLQAQFNRRSDWQPVGDLMPGDVLLRHDHTAIYIGDRDPEGRHNIVHASLNKRGMAFGYWRNPTRNGYTPYRFVGAASGGNLGPYIPYGIGEVDDYSGTSALSSSQYLSTSGRKGNTYTASRGSRRIGGPSSRSRYGAGYRTGDAGLDVLLDGTGDSYYGENSSAVLDVLKQAVRQLEAINGNTAEMEGLLENGLTVDGLNSGTPSLKSRSVGGRKSTRNIHANPALSQNTRTMYQMNRR